MIAAILILTGWTILVAAAAFTWGRNTAPQPHMSVTDMALDHRYRLSEGAESNVVQLRREG